MERDITLRTATEAPMKMYVDTGLYVATCPCAGLGRPCESEINVNLCLNRRLRSTVSILILLDVFNSAT